MWWWKKDATSELDRTPNESTLREIDKYREIFKTNKARQWNTIGHF